MCTVVAVDLVITAHSGLKIGRKVQWILNYFLFQIEKKVVFLVMTYWASRMIRFLEIPYVHSTYIVKLKWEHKIFLPYLIFLSEVLIHRSKGRKKALFCKFVGTYFSANSR